METETAAAEEDEDVLAWVGAPVAGVGEDEDVVAGETTAAEGGVLRSEGMRRR